MSWPVSLEILWWVEANFSISGAKARIFSLAIGVRNVLYGRFKLHAQDGEFVFEPAEAWVFQQLEISLAELRSLKFVQRLRLLLYKVLTRVPSTVDGSLDGSLPTLSGWRCCLASLGIERINWFKLVRHGDLRSRSSRCRVFSGMFEVVGGDEPHEMVFKERPIRAFLSSKGLVSLANGFQSSLDRARDFDSRTR